MLTRSMGIYISAIELDINTDKSNHRLRLRVLILAESALFFEYT